MRKMYVTFAFAVSAAIILAGLYATLAPSWSSYFECDDTAAPSDCYCPDHLVKHEEDGIFNCEAWINPDEIPKDNPTDREPPGPEDPVQ